MKKQIFILLLLLPALSVQSLGQLSDLSPVFLTNYTFTNDGGEIGSVMLRGLQQAEIKKVSVKGEHAKDFRVNRQHILILQKVPAGVSVIDLALTVETPAGSYENTFRLVKDEFIKNKVVAHRGAWKNTGAAENSIASLQHAIAMGCEGSEFDVHMSADSVLFVNHDPHVKGRSIAKSNSQDLRELKLSNGENLPTLEAYLNAGANQNKTKLVLEIKTSEVGKASSIALANKVVQMVERLQLQAIVDYIAFDYDVCKEVMRIAPYAKVAYLNGDKTPASLAENHFYGLDYNQGVISKNPEWITEAKQNKLTVNVWTVNDRSAMEKLLQQQVDFITTNEPELLLTLVAAKK